MTFHVQVLNPVPGESDQIKPKRAKALVKAKFAAWVAYGLTVRLTQYTEDQMAKVNAWIAQQLGYDRDVETVMSTQKQIQGLPCMKPVQLLTIARVVLPERRPRMKNAVICRNGIECIGQHL